MVHISPVNLQQTVEMLIESPVNSYGLVCGSWCKPMDGLLYVDAKYKGRRWSDKKCVRVYDADGTGWGPHEYAKRGGDNDHNYECVWRCTVMVRDLSTALCKCIGR